MGVIITPILLPQIGTYPIPNSNPDPRPFIISNERWHIKRTRSKRYLSTDLAPSLEKRSHSRWWIKISRSRFSLRQDKKLFEMIPLERSRLRWNLPKEISLKTKPLEIPRDSRWCLSKRNLLDMISRGLAQEISSRDKIYQNKFWEDVSREISL